MSGSRRVSMISSGRAAAMRARSAPHMGIGGHQVRACIDGGEAARCGPGLSPVAARPTRDRVDHLERCGGAAARDFAVFQVSRSPLSFRLERRP